MLRLVLSDQQDKTRKNPGGGEICPTLTAGEPEIYVFIGVTEDDETDTRDR